MSKAVKYIETGILSCPLLPENWEIKKLKYLAKVQTGRTPSIQGAKVDFFENGDINWFTPADFGNERNLDNSSRKVNQFALDNGEIQLFANHSIYLVSIGATIGKIGISEKSGSANQQINVISFYEDINPVFGFYFLKSISSILINEVDFTTLPILNQTKTKDIFIPFPSIKTQEIIANFLDQKTTEIDNLISKKQKLIDCLKEERMAIINQAVTKGINPTAEMKDSGIEWLGEIPKHWEVKKLKYVAKLRDEQIEDSEFKIAVENIESFSGKIVGMEEEKKYQSSLSAFKKGDTIFNKLRPYLHKVYYAEKDGGLFGELLVLYSLGELTSKFLYFKLFEKYFINLVDGSTQGTKMPRANWEDFIKEQLISYPSDKSEQYQIVTFIEAQTQRIETTIQKIEQEIELIKEYRTSLINEVVTGKKIVN